MPDAKDAEAQFWETLEVNGAAARTYAVNSGAITVAPSVGNARILSGLGLEIAEISASVSYEDEPIIYASINTTSFSNATYNTNGEQSWGILNEMVDAFPSYIPKVSLPHEREGNLLLERSVFLVAHATEAFLGQWHVPRQHLDFRRFS